MTLTDIFDVVDASRQLAQGRVGPLADLGAGGLVSTGVVMAS